MTAVAFDTLKFARRLRETAGVSPEHAEGFADAISDALSVAELATKSDLRELEVSLKSDMRDLEVSLKSDMRDLEGSLKSDMRELEVSLKSDMRDLEGSLKSDMRDLEARMTLQIERQTIRLGGMMIIAVGIILTAIRYLHP
jgi:hypothetical protein